MRRVVLEQSILFISVIKWFVLASVVGIIVGLSTTVFLKALDISTNTIGQSKYYFLLLPFGMFLSSLMVKYLTTEAEGHGTEKVIEAVHKRFGRINPLVVPVKLVATIATIATGGSAGKEGPCAQIGAGLTSIFASLLSFNDKDRQKLVICGISAGFATVFGTPIAGAIFGVEVLSVGVLLYDVLFPSFVAGIVGYQTASMLGVEYFHQQLRFIPEFSGFMFLNVCISGIFFGICSFSFIEMLKFIETKSKGLDIWKPFKGLVGGGVLIILTFIFSSRLLGLGLDTIKVALEGNHVNPIYFIAKMLFTSITLSFGGSGGIVTPIFFIGATAGNAFARISVLDISMFSAIGMVAVLAGAANTPISASIMAVELFGSKVAPFATVACVISFLMTGHRSVYPSQILAMTKSPTIITEKGKGMEEIEEMQIKPRPHTFTDLIMKATEKGILLANRLNRYLKDRRRR